jgi:hypothetical protein
LYFTLFSLIEFYAEKHETLFLALLGGLRICSENAPAPVAGAASPWTGR